MYVVSKCLLGYNCKYDGTNNQNKRVMKFAKDHDCVLVCPEVAGGLGCPRPPAEQVWRDSFEGEKTFKNAKMGNLKLITVNQTDVTANYIQGAELEWENIKGKEIKLAILKSKSPACGVGKVYDGTFSGKLVSGNGVFAQLLIDKGIPVKTEGEIDD